MACAAAAAAQVDLGRNDIGRIAEPGTVKVDSLMKVER